MQLTWLIAAEVLLETGPFVCLDACDENGSVYGSLLPSSHMPSS